MGTPTRHMLVVGAVLGAALQACTPMYPTRLSPPVRSTIGPGGLEVGVGQVALSLELRRRDFDEDSRVAVGLLLRNDGAHAQRVELREFTLRITDALGRAQTRSPIATGMGQPPRNLYDTDFVAPVAVAPGETVRAWVAFGEFLERDLREIPERVVLIVPASVARESREVVLSEPGHPPVWHADAVPFGAGLGWGIDLGPDGHGESVSIGLHPRYWLDPAWLGFHEAFGIETTDLGDEACCVFVAGAAVGLPLARGRVSSVSPFVGGTVELLRWHTSSVERGPMVQGGPTLGVNLAFGPLQSQHGPFPVSYERSVLGEFNMDFGVIWWFGEGLPAGGKPGFGFSMDYAVGH